MFFNLPEETQRNFRQAKEVHWLKQIHFKFNASLSLQPKHSLQVENNGGGHKVFSLYLQLNTPKWFPLSPCLIRQQANSTTLSPPSSGPAEGARGPIKLDYSKYPTSIGLPSMKEIPSEMEVAPRYTLLTLLTLFTLFTLFTLLKQQHVCLYILLGKVRTLLEWDDGLLSKKWDRMEWVIPLRLL